MTEAPDLTVCIPTCRRPAKLFDCLRAIKKHNERQYPISVFASGQVDDAFADELKLEYPGIDVVTRREIVGPSHARNILAAGCRTNYLAYMDDDLMCTDGALDRLYEKIQYAPEDIHAGIWREGAGYREAGQLFYTGTGPNGRRLILKSLLSPGDVFSASVRSIQTDACLASFAVATRAFKNISFDPKYSFYLDMFDFFMQCKRAGIKVNTHADSVFEHMPGGYSTTTNRERSDKKEVDYAYFEEKWGMRPHGRLGLPQKKFLMRRARRKLKFAAAKIRP